MLRSIILVARESETRRTLGAALLERDFLVVPVESTDAAVGVATKLQPLFVLVQPDLLVLDRGEPLGLRLSDSVGRLVRVMALTDRPDPALLDACTQHEASLLLKPLGDGRDLASRLDVMAQVSEATLRPAARSEAAQARSWAEAPRAAPAAPARPATARPSAPPGPRVSAPAPIVARARPVSPRAPDPTPITQQPVDGGTRQPSRTVVSLDNHLDKLFPSEPPPEDATNLSPISDPVPSERYVPRLLVVDDSQTFLAYASKALNDAGYEVIAVGDPVQALRLLTKNDPPIDLVVSDLQMPRLDGFELKYEVDRLRESPMPFVMVTARGDEETLERAMQLGIKGFLHKNAAGKELVSTIARALEPTIA